jgi:8-oxo-dGTP pyrophosphatase MutT (NUDIX family)
VTDLLMLLDELRAIAQLGLNYSQDHYDRERYERLMRLAGQEYAGITGLTDDVVKARFRDELGYITPKIGCAAAIFDEQGRILLVKRSDNGKYGLPGGYAEVNQSPQENVRREVWEETGLEVEVGELIGLHYLLAGQYGLPHTFYSLTFDCKVIGGILTPSHETPELGFHDHTTITNWHINHQERAITAHRRWSEACSNGA